MSFGASITNNTGSVIIDATYKNYGIASTTTVNLASSAQLAYSQVNGSNPMVFVRSSVANGFIGIYEMTSTYIQFCAVDINDNIITPSFQVMLAYPGITNTDPTNMGVQVRDGVGNVTYDSRWNVPRVGAILTGAAFGAAVPAPTDVANLTHSLGVSNAWFCLNMSQSTRLFAATGGVGCTGATSTWYGFLTANLDSNTIQYKRGKLKYAASSYIVHTPPYTAPYNTAVLYNA